MSVKVPLGYSAVNCSDCPTGDSSTWSQVLKAFGERLRQAIPIGCGGLLLQYVFVAAFTVLLLTLLLCWSGVYVTFVGYNDKTTNTYYYHSAGCTMCSHLPAPIY
jgi:hypothetical protein